MFTPKQLEEISFNKVVFGGYSMSAVDEFLEALFADYTALYADNAQLKQRMKLMSEKMEAMHQESSAAAATAENAKAEAQQVLAKAREEAQKIVEEAKANAKACCLSAEQVTKLQGELQSFISYLDTLKEEEAEVEAPAQEEAPVVTGYPSIDRPWLKFYPPEMMKMMKVPPITLNQYMKAMCKGEDLVAIHYYGTDLTWKEIFEAVDNCARALRACGLGEGDQIPVMLANVPEYLMLLLAAERIGASLLCRDNTIEENAYAVSKSGAKVMFAHDYLSPSDMEVYRAAGVERFVFVDPWKRAVREEIPEHVVRHLKGRYVAEPVVAEDVISWDDFMAAGHIYVGHINAPDNPERPLYRAYTSGSTGTSKQVVHCARTFLGVLCQTAFPGDPNNRRTWVTAMLVPQLTAITVSMILLPLASDMILICDPFIDAEDIDLELMRYKPNNIGTLPMFMEIYMRSKRIPADYDLSHLLINGTGSESVSNNQIRRWEKFLKDHGSPAQFSVQYGMSESASNMTYTGFGRPQGDGCMGIPMPLNTISIFRGTKECTYNTVGEICLCAPSVMLGYDDPEKTATTLVEHDDGKVWLHTGDTGYMDEAGFLYTLGRGLSKRYHEDHEKAQRLVQVIIENKVSDAEIEGLYDSYFVMRPDKEHDGYDVPYMYAIFEEGYGVADIEDKVKAALDEFEWPVEIIALPERPFYHFKTNRLHLPAPYAR